jgi:hypothetical protein
MPMPARQPVMHPEMGHANYVPAGFACRRCTQYVDAAAKFCGSCGEAASLDKRAVAGQATGQYTVQTAARMASNMANVQAENFYRSHQQATPSFAAPKRRNKVVPPEMREEMTTIITMLVRERVFLIMHYAIFVVTNLIGFIIAYKCYVEFIGDDVTKTMVASTPLLFINLCALCCLVPIKGTKREIARLRDRMTNLKLRLEFEGVM